MASSRTFSFVSEWKMSEWWEEKIKVVRTCKHVNSTSSRLLLALTKFALDGP